MSVKLLKNKANSQISCQQLFAEIQACNKCQDQLPLPAKPILQVNEKARILIAGQAPGAVTHDKGIPFDDKSGDRLRQWLNVSREQFYNPELFAIVPMGFCYPGKGKSGDLPPIPTCAQTWQQPLLDKLTNIELTIVLGQYAINWHLAEHLKIAKIQAGKEKADKIQKAKKPSITKLTQQWQQLLTQNIIVLPHPSPRNNIWLKRNPWFEQEVIPALQARVNEIL